MKIENIEKAYQVKTQISELKKIADYKRGLTLDKVEMSSNNDVYYTVLNHRCKDSSKFNFSKETSERINTFLKNLVEEEIIKKENELNDML